LKNYREREKGKARLKVATTKNDGGNELATAEEEGSFEVIFLFVATFQVLSVWRVVVVASKSKSNLGKQFWRCPLWRVRILKLGFQP
jgi:hypothetical protein